jgi:anti-sigma factor RsiW
MTETLCVWLDDYLANDLPAGDASRFTAHLPACAACTKAVREHERLAGLLNRAVELEQVPMSLNATALRRLRLARRRRIAAVAVSVAASVVVALGLIRWIARSEIKPEIRETAPEIVQKQPQAPAKVAVPSAPKVRVTFPPDSGVIAVPVPVDNPNVTFIWIYPGLRRSPQADDAEQPSTDLNAQ